MHRPPRQQQFLDLTSVRGEARKLLREMMLPATNDASSGSSFSFDTSDLSSSSSEDKEDDRYKQAAKRSR